MVTSQLDTGSAGTTRRWWGARWCLVAPGYHTPVAMTRTPPSAPGGRPLGRVYCVLTLIPTCYTLFDLLCNVCMCVYVCMCVCVCVPVRVEDLAEGELAAHPQVGLMLWEVRGRTAGRVHLTVLIWLVQSFNELTWRHRQSRFNQFNIKTNEFIHFFISTDWLCNDWWMIHDWSLPQWRQTYKWSRFKSQQTL